MTKRTYYRRKIRLDDLPERDVRDLNAMAVKNDCLNIEEYFLKVVIPNILKTHRA